MAIKHYQSIGELSRSEELQLQMARGLIGGHTSLNIAGYQATVGSTFIPIWENAAAYVYPVAAGQMRLWSSSASDVNVLIRISGLDANYAMISEELLLTAGTTGVLTAKSYWRITNLTVIDGVNPVGVISLGDDGKTAEYAKIAINAGTSSRTVYTVPAGYTFYLAKVNVYANQSGGGGSTRIIRYRAYTINNSGIVRAVLQTPFSSEYISEKTVPRPYFEKTDCQWQCQATTSAEIGMQVEGILVKNDEI
jgi:hypothetical protein